MSVIKKTTETGTVEADQCGKDAHHNQVPEEQKKYVFQHINSFPVRSSHYTRTQNPYKQYIDIPNKESQSWLYTKYCEWLGENHPGVEPVRESYYLNIYNTCYNLEITPPRVDTCDICHRLCKKIKEEKAAGKDTREVENF